VLKCSAATAADPLRVGSLRASAALRVTSGVAAGAQFMWRRVTSCLALCMTGSPEPVLGWVAFYHDEEAMRARALELSASEIEEHRPFAGDKLWLIFVVLRSV
jgi:hypothetical protein